MDTTIRSALKNCVERNSQNSKSSSDCPFQALFHFSELTDTSANGYESIVVVFCQEDLQIVEDWGLDFSKS